MSAIETALQVLEWASEPEGPPPLAGLEAVDKLLAPDAAALARLGQFAAQAAAKLGVPAPPWDDPEPPGPAGLLLAAAIGAARHPAAVELARCADPPRNAWDQVARHALVRAALAHVPPLLGEALLAAAPLTCLWLVPPPGQENHALQLAEQLLAHPAGRRLLAHHYAEPTRAAPWLAWRGSLLDRLRADPAFRAFVLDVYETAFALHRPAWQGLTSEAWALLDGGELTEDGYRFVAAVADWWQPLRALYRAEPARLRERTYLDFELYLQGIRLAHWVGQIPKVPAHG